MKLTLSIGSVAVLVLFLLAFTGCEGVLDVDNPNALLEADIEVPIAQRGLVNGTVMTVMQGIGEIYSVYSVVSDEVTWIGSRDAFGVLDRGYILDHRNEFSDQAWPFTAEGRWMSDRSIEILRGFDQAGALGDPRRLATVLLYNALIYIVIAETYENYVFSDKMNTQPAIGEANMAQLFDTAIGRLNEALDYTAGDAELERMIYGLLARGHYSKALWQLLYPKPASPPDPYVNSSEAVAAAEQALSRMEAGYRWFLDYRSGLVWNGHAWWLVGRAENAFNEPPLDPISGNPDPRVIATQDDFRDRVSYLDQHSPITVISAREMNLIIAENDFANNRNQAALDRINQLRSLDNLPPATLDNLEVVLRHERRANLYNQGRRLQDMYRFGEVSPRWESASHAVQRKGSLFPIAEQERRANPHID